MQYDLVFEGGGAKGIVFVGALQEFEARGHSARRIVGTSAGAISATLLAAGYRSDELLAAVNEKTAENRSVFSTFMDVPTEDAFAQQEIEESLTYTIFEHLDLPALPEMLEKNFDRLVFQQLMKLKVYRELFFFVEAGGLYRGEAFRQWITNKLNAKTPNLGQATLGEFREQTHSDLSVVVSDTTGHNMLVLNHRTAPACPVAWAVRMSMSIPFLWWEVRWRSEWGTYRGVDISGHAIVDGGALSNFPIYLIAAREPDVISVMGNTDPAGAPNLGFLIDETLEVEGAPAKPEEKGTEQVKGDLLNHVSHLRTVSRIKCLVDTITTAHDRNAIDAHQGEVCRLPAKGYGTTEFEMTDPRRDALVRAGRKAMTAFFEHSQ